MVPPRSNATPLPAPFGVPGAVGKNPEQLIVAPKGNGALRARARKVLQVGGFLGHRWGRRRGTDRPLMCPCAASGERNPAGPLWSPRRRSRRSVADAAMRGEPVAAHSASATRCRTRSPSAVRGCDLRRLLLRSRHPPQAEALDMDLAAGVATPGGAARAVRPAYASLKDTIVIDRLAISRHTK